MYLSCCTVLMEKSWSNLYVLSMPATLNKGKTACSFTLFIKEKMLCSCVVKKFQVSVMV